VVKGLPDYTRTVSVSVEVTPMEPTVKEWNRGFELGDLTEWTAFNAVISEVEPYEGDYCCKLLDTDSSITQTLDEPMPVNGVWMLKFRARSAAGTKAVKPIINYTDGTSSEGGQTIWADEWTDVHMLRRDMNAEKIVSGIAIESAAGELFIDAVFLGFATEVLTGAVEVTQATAENLQAELRPRPKGGVLVKNKKDTVVGWDTIASHTVTEGKYFQLSKVVVSVEYATWIQYRWAGDVISCERLMDEKTILLEHFPWDYEEMEGADTDAFEVQAKWYEEEGIVNVEIVGEEV